MKCADLINKLIIEKNSILVAGFDPRIENLPKFIIPNNILSEIEIHNILSTFYISAIPVISPYVACIKPNIAFFERYGIGGLRAYRDICVEAHNHGLIVIADIKRGDIGSTAESYAEAFLSNSPLSFYSDLITINPFLGFDTLKVFIDAAKKYDKGLFVLVRTSNSGCCDLQDVKDQTTGQNISQKVASFINSHADELLGECGMSALGSVLGATSPIEAEVLRNLMPKSIALVPGFGAQGGTASDALSVSLTGSDILVNASRGIFSDFSNCNDMSEVLELIKFNANRLRNELNVERAHKIK